MLGLADELEVRLAFVLRQARRRRLAILDASLVGRLEEVAMLGLAPP